MHRRTQWIAGLLLLLPAGLAHAQDKDKGKDNGPAVSIVLQERQAKATPQRRGFNHTGGGNIDVAQPAPDTVVVTMSGVAVAGAHPLKDSLASLDFDLTQCFEVVADKNVKQIKLTVETRVIGLLRSHKGGGTAQESGGVSIARGPVALVAVAAPPHAVSGGENLSINDREGPSAIAVAPGKHTLHQTFHVGVSHCRTLCACKAASAEFAPDPALDPLWISYWEPFHGANKKDFGYQVTIRVTAE